VTPLPPSFALFAVAKFNYLYSFFLSVIYFEESKSLRILFINNIFFKKRVLGIFHGEKE